MKSIKTLFTSLISLLVVSCGQDVSVVESGTYSGKVKEVNTDEREIYVELEDDKTIELYFTDSTSLMKGGKQVEFTELKKDNAVKVKVEKMGKKLNPLAVKIKE
jgi:hypothetical protein